jgi:hypothetical protein
MDVFLRTVKVAILALCLPVTIVVDFVACIAYSIFFTIVVAPSVCCCFLQYVCLDSSDGSYKFDVNINYKLLTATAIRTMLCIGRNDGNNGNVQDIKVGKVGEKDVEKDVTKAIDGQLPPHSRDKVLA